VVRTDFWLALPAVMSAAVQPALQQHDAATHGLSQAWCPLLVAAHPNMPPTVQAVQGFCTCRNAYPPDLSRCLTALPVLCPCCRFAFKSVVEVLREHAQHAKSN
jgi:hypothetical protein